MTYMDSRTFRVFLDEVAEGAQKILKAKATLLKVDPDSDAYYDAIADLHVALTVLEVKVPRLLKEIDRVAEHLPEP